MYNVQVKRYLSESQISIYDRSIKTPGCTFDCDEWGVILPKKKRADDRDMEYNPFTDSMESMPSIDWVERRASESIRTSMHRTKTQIGDWARSNQWEWFVTFTFSPEKVDRYDYSAVSKAMAVWLSNIRRACPDLRYILVPELHEDGAYHFHGLFAKCDGFGLVYSGVRQGGVPVYNISKFHLGFTNAQRVKSTEKAAMYVLKYITKELCAVTKGKKRYWVSRNLNKPVVGYFTINGNHLKDFIRACHASCDHFSESEGEYQKVKRFEMKSLKGLPLGNTIDKISWESWEYGA